MSKTATIKATKLRITPDLRIELFETIAFPSPMIEKITATIGPTQQTKLLTKDPLPQKKASKPRLSRLGRPAGWGDCLRFGTSGAGSIAPETRTCGLGEELTNSPSTGTWEMQLQTGQRTCFPACATSTRMVDWQSGQVSSFFIIGGVNGVHIAK